MSEAMERHPFSPGTRLGYALAAAAVGHAVLILGLGFKRPGLDSSPAMPALEVVLLAIVGLQILAVLSGAVCYLVLDRRTLSDVLTGTRVVIHRESEPVAPVDGGRWDPARAES